MKKILIFILILLFAGCVKSRDYVSVGRGAVRMNVVVPFGQGRAFKNYLVIDDVAIDKGDTMALVKNKLGEPSHIGITMEGYQFYRYENKAIEIYFDEDRVVSWTRIDFKP